MTRTDVIHAISYLLDSRCHDCPIREELNRKHRSRFALVDGHCNKHCDVGSQLQDLGRRLKRNQSVLVQTREEGR